MNSENPKPKTKQEIEAEILRLQEELRKLEETSVEPPPTPTPKKKRKLPTGDDKYLTKLNLKELEQYGFKSKQEMKKYLDSKGYGDNKGLKLKDLKNIQNGTKNEANHPKLKKSKILTTNSKNSTTLSIENLDRNKRISQSKKKELKLLGFGGKNVNAFRENATKYLNNQGIKSRGSDGWSSTGLRQMR
jgi:hypothetical protein